MFTVRGTQFPQRPQAVAYAVSIAASSPGDGIPVYSRPGYAAAIVRHDDNDTLVHKLDRYGREQAGDRWEGR